MSWKVVKNDGDTIVLKNRPDDDGMGCFVIIIIILLAFFSGGPTESDLGTEKYLKKAESATEHFVLNWQEKNWEGRGWKPKSITNFRQPEYEVEIAAWKKGDSARITDRVSYLGKSCYRVIVVTDTHLKSKKGNYGSVRETFVLKIKRTSDNDYSILEAEKTWMYPSQEEFDAMLINWTKP